MTQVRVFAMSGSLRKGSYNTALMHAAIELAPEGMTFEIGEFRDLPLYDEDVRSAGLPDAVVRLRAQAAPCEAVLLVTPEYNYSVPGGLKNAIDWISRPPAQSFAGKPLCIMSASSGMLGGSRAQYHLRQVAVFLDMHPINKPEVIVGRAPEKFDAAMRLTDEPTRVLVRQQLEALALWSARLRAPSSA